MRMGYVRLIVEYAVDLDNPAQVEIAKDFVCEDIDNVVKFNETESYLDTVEDSSLDESDIHNGILELSGMGGDEE